MFSGHSKRDSAASGDRNLGQLELEVDEAYIADRTKAVARLDKESMSSLNISAGDGVIIFAGERPVIAKAFPLYPSDNSSGVIKINQMVRRQLRREIGDTVTVRGIGNTKIDKVVNYLLLDRLSRRGD
jgi:formylmethanofuran dehydrogenase subunit D